MPQEYWTLLNAAGRAAFANAVVTEGTVDIAEVAVGTGDPATVANIDAAAALQAEEWRGEPTLIAVHETNPNWIIIEIVIPSDVGGFAIQEVGIFNSTGVLIGIGRYPSTVKPVVEEGALADLVIRFTLQVSDASVVNLVIDPTVAIASRAYVDSKIIDALADQLLGDHADVTLTSPAINDVLVFTSEGWQSGQSIDRSAQKRIALLSYYREMDMAAANFGLLNDRYDAFLDATGIDAALSDNWTMGDGFAKNTGTVDADEAVTTGSATITLAGGVWSPGGDYAGRRSVTPLSGDFVVEFTFGAAGAQGWTIGVFDAAEVGSWLESGSSTAGVDSIANSWAANWSEGIRKGSSQVNSTNFVNGDTIKFERIAGTIAVHRNGALLHTYAGTFNGDVHVSISTTAGGTATLTGWVLGDGAPAAMDLVSVAIEPETEPAGAHTLLIVEDVNDAVPIPGVDIIQSVSKDDGATWEAVTLTKDGETDEGYLILSGIIPVMATTGDKTIRVRTVTSDRDLWHIRFRSVQF